MRDSHYATPDNLDVIGRPKMTKVDIGPTTPLSSVVKEAAKRAYGKQEAAAAHLGKDKGNFSRDVDAGRVTLRDLDALGAPFLSELGKELTREYGPLSDPADRADRLLEAADSIISELRQFVRSTRAA
jgi:hypothetical protein